MSTVNIMLISRCDRGTNLDQTNDVQRTVFMLKQKFKVDKQNYLL